MLLGECQSVFSQKTLTFIAPTLLPSATGNLNLYFVSQKDSTMALGLAADEDDATLECISRQNQSSKKNLSPFVTFSQLVPFPGGIMDRDRGGISCFTVNNTEHKMCCMD